MASSHQPKGARYQVVGAGHFLSVFLTSSPEKTPKKPGIPARPKSHGDGSVAGRVVNSVRDNCRSGDRWMKLELVQAVSRP